MSKFEYKEKLNGRFSKVNIEINYSKLPLMAKIFGKRIFSEDEADGVKCESEIVIYKRISYIVNQIYTVKRDTNKIGDIRVCQTEKECIDCPGYKIIPKTQKMECILRCRKEETK